MLFSLVDSWCQLLVVVAADINRLPTILLPLKITAIPTSMRELLAVVSVVVVISVVVDVVVVVVVVILSAVVILAVFVVFSLSWKQ